MRLLDHGLPKQATSAHIFPEFLLERASDTTDKKVGNLNAIFGLRVYVFKIFR